MNKLFLLPLLFSSFLVLAQTNPSEEKLAFYLAESNKAIKEKDYSFACELMSHSLIYAKSVFNAEKYQNLEKQKMQVCNISLNKAVENLNNFRNNHPYASMCPAYRQSVQACSPALDFDGCMQKRFGPFFKSVKDSAICGL
jgi:hypothetical protein